MNIMKLFETSELANAEFDLDKIKGSAKKIADMQRKVGGRARLTAKVGSGGVKVFTISNGVKEMVLEKIRGIVIASHNCNVLFPPRKDKDNNTLVNLTPLCSSADGITGMAEDGECRNCAECPYNTFGSKGKGKACKNMHRLYILVEDVPIPIVLTLPPTSLETWRNYAIMDIAAADLEMDEVLTEFTLLTAEAGVNKYSIVSFSAVGKVSKDVTDFCRALSGSLERPEPPKLSDYKPEALPEQNAIVMQDEPDDELPNWAITSKPKRVVAVNHDPGPARAVPAPLNMALETDIGEIPCVDYDELSFDSL